MTVAKRKPAVRQSAQSVDDSSNPYAVPESSETLTVNSDGEVLEYGGMQRGAYWGWNFGLNFLALIPIIGQIGAIVGTVHVIRQRCVNLGYSLWYGWTIFIPFYNFL